MSNKISGDQTHENYVPLNEPPHQGMYDRGPDQFIPMGINTIRVNGLTSLTLNNGCCGCGEENPTVIASYNSPQVSKDEIRYFSRWDAQLDLTNVQKELIKIYAVKGRILPEESKK
jgi:hypothetical protein